VTIAVLESQSLGLRHLVHAAGDRGHDVVLLTSDRSRYSYDLGLLRDDIEVVEVETTDVDKVVAILQAGYPDVAGVVRMTDKWSLPALAVATALGLPHENADAIGLLRDKGRLRNHLHDNGFSKARSITFDPGETPSAVPYPAIVKDVAGGSSENVWLVKRPADMPAVLAEARAVTLRGGALVAEPYFTGPLYSAETVSWDGRTRVLGVTSRAMSPEPYFREEIGSFPVRLPDRTNDELAEWISAILTSVGYREGVTHTELIVTTEGFEIVEINARMGGALIGEAVNQALGINMHSAFADLALGRRPTLMDESFEVRQGVTQVAVYAPATGVFDRIDGAEALAGHPGSPVLYPFRNPGDVIESTIDQRGGLGLVLATGATSELSMHNAMSAAGKLTPRMR
jgi:biotin carboxylase